MVVRIRVLLAGIRDEPVDADYLGAMVAGERIGQFYDHHRANSIRPDQSVSEPGSAAPGTSPGR